MFSRVKPVLASLVPGRKVDPRVEELKPWARATVTAWVAILVPVLLVMFGLMAITAPRLMATAWSSLGTQWDLGRHALSAGSYPRVALAVVQVVALVLPVAGLVASFWRVGVRVSQGFWNRTVGRPLLRGTGLAIAATLAALVAFTWWPHDQYRPIRPDERGTLASATVALRHATRSDPTGGGTAGLSQKADATGTNRAGAPSTAPPPGGSSDETTDSGGGTTSNGSTPPPPPGEASADTSTPGEVTLTWTLPAEGDVAGITVRRGDDTACPASPTSGTAVGGSSLRSSQVDAAIVPGSSYCYSIFTLNSASTPSTPATVTATVPAAEPSTSSGGTSTG